LQAGQIKTIVFDSDDTELSQLVIESPAVSAPVVLTAEGEIGPTEEYRLSNLDRLPAASGEALDAMRRDSNRGAWIARIALFVFNLPAGLWLSTRLIARRS
jgi:hypothetical protein